MRKLSPVVEEQWKAGKLSPEDNLSVLRYLAENEGFHSHEIARAVDQVQNLAPCSLGIFGYGFFAAALAQANTLKLALDVKKGEIPSLPPPETIVHVMQEKLDVFIGHFPMLAKFYPWESADVPADAITAIPQRAFDIAVVLNASPVALDMAWESSADDGYVMAIAKTPEEDARVVQCLGEPVSRVQRMLIYPGRLRRQPVKIS